jgi:hypothetical protein
MAPAIWSKLPVSEQVALIAAGLALGAAPAAAEERVEVIEQDGVKAEVRVEGGGQAQVQIRAGAVGAPNGAVIIRPGGESEPAAEVKPTLTVKQDQPGGPATFTFTLPENAPGTLAEAPTVTAYFGEPRVVDKSLTKTGCQFAWDVPAVRKENPALRGSELTVTWKLAPIPVAGRPQPEPTTYTTGAYLTLSPEGAATITRVETRIAPSVRVPLVCEMAPMPAYRYTHNTPEFSFSAVRFGESKSTTLSVTLRGGQQFAAQPEVKATVGELAARPKWDDNRRTGSDSASLAAPKELPKEDKDGAVTWTYTSRNPATGEERAGAITATVKMSAKGDLSVTKVEGTSKVTKEGRRPEVCEMAPAPGLRGQSARPAGDNLPLASRFAARIRSAPLAERQVRLTADVAYTDLAGLTFAWSVTGGRLDAANAREAVWTLPDRPGKYLAQVVVTDRQGGLAVPALIVDV